MSRLAVLTTVAIALLVALAGCGKKVSTPARRTSPASVHIHVIGTGKRQREVVSGTRWPVSSVVAVGLEGIWYGNAWDRFSVKTDPSGGFRLELSLPDHSSNRKPFGPEGWGSGVCRPLRVRAADGAVARSAVYTPIVPLGPVVGPNGPSVSNLNGQVPWTANKPVCLFLRPILAHPPAIKTLFGTASPVSRATLQFRPRSVPVTSQWNGDRKVHLVGRNWPRHAYVTVRSQETIGGIVVRTNAAGSFDLQLPIGALVPLCSRGMGPIRAAVDGIERWIVSSYQSPLVHCPLIRFHQVHFPKVRAVTGVLAGYAYGCWPAGTCSKKSWLINRPEPRFS